MAVNQGQMCVSVCVSASKDNLLMCEVYGNEEENLAHSHIWI